MKEADFFSKKSQNKKMKGVPYAFSFSDLVHGLGGFFNSKFVVDFSF